MMDDYSQPDFYRFNQDSTSLIKWVLKQNLRPQSILDLGAGSGIIGIELSRELKPRTLTLVELQTEFKDHLEINLREFLKAEVEAEIYIQSFAHFQGMHKFDLIVCNPPYYLPGAGQLPVNPNRARARSFVEDSWEILIKCIKQSLSPKGEGYIVVKNDKGLVKKIEDHATLNSLHLQKESEGELMFLKLSAIL